MTGKADVETHLSARRGTITNLFQQWNAGDIGGEDRAAIVERYFVDADIGSVRRVGYGNSVYVTAELPHPKRASVLVVGRHDVAGLAAAAPGISTVASLVGPGLASRIGPTVAFAEGVQIAAQLTAEAPVNTSFLSLGDGDTFADVSKSLPISKRDGVYLTNSVVWSPTRPTITTGARGRLVAELSLTAGAPVVDFETSGATRNPLTTMTKLLGELRDDRGRIAIPGFYDRAQPPDAAIRAALAADDHNPDGWVTSLNRASPSGTLSSLERAAMWPGVSVLSIAADVADGTTAPGQVTATVAFYLIPDQRHVEVEGALRDWLDAHVAKDLNPSVKITSSARPWRAVEKSTPVAAQSRAALRLSGREPLFVPAGGPAGSGEIAFALGAPVAFAGIAHPSSTYGTHAESLLWSEFDGGVAMAAETVLQLRRA